MAGRKVLAARPRKRASQGKTLDRARLIRNIVRLFSKIKAVEAIFVRVDETDVCHIYSVVPEHRPRIYSGLIKAEDSVMDEAPAVLFDFHVRASQGRPPEQAVPTGLPCAFRRDA